MAENVSLVIVQKNALQLTVKVLEVGQLDPFPHAEHESSRAKAVQGHPDVPCVQSSNLLGRLAGNGIPSVCSQCMRNISPGSDDTTGNHESKGEESHSTNRSSKPQHLAVCDEDNGQVLEDGVYGNAEELQRFDRSVDHANEEKRDGKPLAGLIGVEVAVCDEPHGFACCNGYYADNGLRGRSVWAHLRHHL